MKSIFLFLLFISSACVAQQTTKEEFLNDFLASGQYVSLDDETRDSVIFIYRECSPTYVGENYFECQFLRGEKPLDSNYKPDYCLPDRYFAQILINYYKDTGKVCYWNQNAVKNPPGKQIFFVTGEELNLLFDKDYKLKKCSAQHKDSLKKSMKQLEAAKKRYKMNFSVYDFEMPVVDAGGNYAVLYHAHYCRGLCGDGHYDLYKKTNGHWVYITTGYSSHN